MQIQSYSKEDRKAALDFGVNTILKRKNSEIKKYNDTT